MDLFERIMFLEIINYNVIKITIFLHGRREARHLSDNLGKWPASHRLCKSPHCLLLYIHVWNFERDRQIGGSRAWRKCLSILFEASMYLACDSNGMLTFDWNRSSLMSSVRWWTNHITASWQCPSLLIRFIQGFSWLEAIAFRSFQVWVMSWKES